MNNIEINNAEIKRQFLFEYVGHNQKIIKRLSIIGYYIKSFSLTLFGIVMGMYFSIDFIDLLSRIIFLISMIFVFLFFWIVDVINLKNEKIFRLDYSYKIENWKNMNNNDIFDVLYFFKKIEKQDKNKQLKNSIFNFFTIINLILIIPLFILLFL